MMPTSEEIEAFHDRAKALDARLARLKSAEVAASDLIMALAATAKEWLKYSAQLKSGVEGFLPSLELYDRAMAEVLVSTKQRSRATAYRSKLSPFLDGFLDAIVIPLMRFEGSPAQTAARQLEASFADAVTVDEAAYIQEAARCSSLHCNRAAIILLWAAGMSRIHNAVQRVGFDRFNACTVQAAAKKGTPFNRITKSLQIASLAELQRARDFDLIAVGMDLWSYDLQVFEELDRLLGTRNNASHPGMFTPTSLDVRQFADKVLQCIFKRIN